MKLKILILSLYFLIVSGEDEVVKQRVYVGQSVKLKCGPLSRFVNIPMKFQWEKPIGNIIGNQPILTLSNVDFIDGGTYTCRVKHTINNEEIEKILSTQLLINNKDDDGSSTNIFPRDSPTIQFKPPVVDNKLELSEISYIYMECLVSNWQNNEYTVRWLKNGQQIGEVSKTLFKFPIDSNRDSGYYYCEVKHNSAPQQVYQKQLEVKISKPVFTIESLPGENLKLGGRIFRKCHIAGKDQLEYSWLKDGTVRAISSNEILDVEIKDIGANGRYTCNVKAPNGLKVFQSSITVNINGGAGPVNPSDIRVTIFTTPNSPQLNQQFQLNCEAFPPQPLAKYLWRRNGQIVGDSRQLFIPSFTKADTGKYQCEVSIDGSAVTSGVPLSRTQNTDINFQLTTSNKIELEEDGSQMISSEGDKRELHCEVPTNGNSKGASVVWYFRGQLLDTRTQQQLNILRSDRIFVSILTLNFVTLSNEGKYTCQVEGLTKTANLVVLKSKPLLAVNPNKIEVFEGDPAEFHCRVNNVRDVKNDQLTWSFRPLGRRAADSLRRQPTGGQMGWEISNSALTPETSFISLESCRVADSGFYVCTAPNGDSKYGELIVKARNLQVTVTPKEVRTRPGKSIIIECFSNNPQINTPSGNPDFFFANGLPVTSDRRFSLNRLGPGRIQISIPSGLFTQDNGMVVECKEGSAKDSAIIYVEDQCPTNYRRCNSGQCLPASQFCDSRIDCTDGSDEIPSVCNKCEPLYKTCEVYNGVSPIKKTYIVHWECDGENDCGNNYDESNCASHTAICGSLKFKCFNGKSIPNAYRCDQENDCSSGEDEANCLAPQIIARSDKNPTSKGVTTVLRIIQGASINLTCEVRGNPLPRLVWRQNWGCLLDRSRQSVSSQLYRSVSGSAMGCDREVSSLQIVNFQPSDAGIYNCESTSGTSRAFSDDFQLILASTAL